MCPPVPTQNDPCAPLHLPRPHDAHKKSTEFCLRCQSLLKHYGELSQASGGQTYHNTKELVSKP